MKLSSFSENIQSVPYKRGGEVLMLQVNIDAMVPEYYDVLEFRLAPLLARIADLQKKYEKQQEDRKSKKKIVKPISTLQLEKEVVEIEREANAERLTTPVELPDGSTTCLLKGWDLESDDEMPLAANKETLVRMPPRAVAEIWAVCLKASTTVKKREDEETEEIMESTPSGSKALRVVGQST